MEQNLCKNDVVKDFLAIVQKHGLQEQIELHGSVAYGAVLVPFWSDIDVTVVVDHADAVTMRRIAKMRAEYLRKHPSIPLSLTIVERDDDYAVNYFHHHGVKPMSYNYELARQTEQKVPYNVNLHVLRTSSVYRYYEILHSFRRSALQEFSADAVARGYHRLSRLLRTQVEILHPEMVRELGKLWERRFIDILQPRDIVEEFFRQYDAARASWEVIRLNPKAVQRHGVYLVEVFRTVHEAFLPQLKLLGEQYHAHYC